jgi:biopolymer transport protein ExbD
MAASYRPSDEEHLDDGVVAEINITPLTDVFLVLLIIFMVTTSVAANQSKNIDLPGAEMMRRPRATTSSRCSRRRSPTRARRSSSCAATRR